MSSRDVRTVIFDGECGFCQRSVRWGRALDWLHRIDWRSRLEPGIAERFPQLSREETQRQMVSIRPDGKTYGGFYAVRDVLRYLPLTAWSALLLYLPGVPWLGVPVYRWIARHRYRFAGRAQEACPIPPLPAQHRRESRGRSPAP